MHKQRRPASAGYTLIEVMIVIAIIGILAAFIVPMFVRVNIEEPRADAIRTAESFGFSGVTITESSRWTSQNGCDQGDWFAFQATATDDQNKKVSIVICYGPGTPSGQAKGYTVWVR